MYSRWSKYTYVDTHIEDWSQIFVHKSALVRRSSGVQFHPYYLVEGVKHQVSLMVWFVIASMGIRRLNTLEKTMRQDQYNSVKNWVIAKAGKWLFDNEKSIFRHASESCPKARSVISLLAKKILPFHPGRRIQRYEHQTKRAFSKDIITTNRQQIGTLLREWHHNHKLQQNAKLCLESMPRRIEVMILAEYGITKY